MKLRQRIGLWYGGVLLVSVLLVSWWAFSELQESQADHAPRLEEAGETALDEAGEMLLFGALPALLFGLIGGAIVTRRALQPLSHLIDQLEQTHVGNLAEPVARSGNRDEIDRLAMVFNSLKVRLAESFDHAREFTLHASHELKTPITIIHSTLERMMKPSTSLPDLQERCGFLIEEVQRLSGIVTQLTFLAQADASQQTLTPETVQLHDLITEAVEDAQLLAANSGIAVSVDALEPCAVVADKMRLRQLLLIVLDNAVKHNVPSGVVRVSLRHQATDAALSVINSGPDLSESERARVFERFFRGEHARNSRIEGSGLGMSIAAYIAQVHGGNITFRSAGEGRHECLVNLPFEQRGTRNAANP
jgi:signal transduction histidine kinase